MLASLFLLTALAAPDSIPPRSARAQDQLAVVVHRQPAVPLVALRLALLGDDPAGYAGAGHLVQHLVEPRLQERVSQVGGQVLLERTSDAVVFTVVGPAVELPALAAALRGALQPQAPDEPSLMRASRQLAEERLAEWEMPARHVRAMLRTRLFPNDLPAAGTETGALRLAEPDGLRRAWAQLYHPDRVVVVAVGDVGVEEVRAAFGALPPPLPAAPEALRDTLSPEPLAPAEATQAWSGIGYRVDRLDPAVVSVAARVLQTHLESRLPGTSIQGEHWWTHHGQALVLLAAAPEASGAAAQRALGTAAAAAAEGLTPLQVREAARALRREMLFFARTPERMAAVLGHFTDRSGEPTAAQSFYSALERVDERQVRDLLLGLRERTPVRVDIPVQKLTPR